MRDLTGWNPNTNTITGYPDEPRTLIMDLMACHNHGCPLDFKGLLEAPLQDFSHDIWGIRAHINRETGMLDDETVEAGPFMPRYALANQVSTHAVPDTFKTELE